MIRLGKQDVIQDAQRILTLMYPVDRSGVGAGHNAVALDTTTESVFNISTAQVFGIDTAASTGDIVYAAGSGPDYVFLNIGASGTYLRSDGASPGWSAIALGDVPAHDLLGSTHGDTVAGSPAIGDLIYGNSSASWAKLPIGASDTYLRSDGASPGWDAVVVGAHDLLSGTHSDTVAASVSRGSLVYGSTSASWAELTVGGAATFLRSDGTDPAWTAPTTSDITDLAYGTPALTLGTTNAAGAADTVIRTNATILVFDATNPTSVDAGDAAVVGVATVASRRDHQHAVTSTADGDTNVSTLLQSDANGGLRLDRLGIGVAPGAGNQITIVDGGTVGNGVLLTFDDAGNHLELSGASMMIGDTANANMTIGLTIQQGANDDEILALKSSDVAHGFTALAETDTYGLFQKMDPGAGGLLIRGMRDASGTSERAIEMTAVLAENASTAKSIGGHGIFGILAAQSSGNAWDDVVADGNLFTIRTTRNATFETTLIVDVEGTIHQVPTGGADIDLDMLVVQVTGAPALSWDESEDRFYNNKGVIVAHALTGAAGSHAAEPVLQLRQTADTNYNIGDIHSGIEFYTGDAGGNFPGIQAYIRAVTTRANGIGSPDAGLVFGTSAGGGLVATDRMIIRVNGNIGFGTTTPGSLTEWNFADEDLGFDDAHVAVSVATVEAVIEVTTTTGGTGYIPIYSSFGT